MDRGFVHDSEGSLSDIGRGITVGWWIDGKLVRTTVNLRMEREVVGRKVTNEH